jgi:hypothetical protein
MDREAEDYHLEGISLLAASLALKTQEEIYSKANFPWPPPGLLGTFYCLQESEEWKGKW